MCQNGGTCVDFQRCVCPDSYTGRPLAGHWAGVRLRVRVRVRGTLTLMMSLLQVLIVRRRSVWRRPVALKCQVTPPPPPRHTCTCWPSVWWLSPSADQTRWADTMWRRGFMQPSPARWTAGGLLWKTAKGRLYRRCCLMKSSRLSRQKNRKQENSVCLLWLSVQEVGSKLCVNALNEQLSLESAEIRMNHRRKPTGWISIRCHCGSANLMVYFDFCLSRMVKALPTTASCRRKGDGGSTSFLYFLSFLTARRLPVRYLCSPCVEFACPPCVYVVLHVFRVLCLLPTSKHAGGSKNSELGSELAQFPTCCAVHWSTAASQRYHIKSWQRLDRVRSEMPKHTDNENWCKCAFSSELLSLLLLVLVIFHNKELR